MKALTLWQPYASAIALGIKRVETRPPWAMRLRAMVGQDMAITAAARPVQPQEFPTTGYRTRRADGGRGRPELVKFNQRTCRYEPVAWLPLRVVVAVVRIAAVERTDTITWVPDGGIAGDLPYGLGRDCLVVVEGQRPWGDYTPGRTAIVLEDGAPAEHPGAVPGLPAGVDAAAPGRPPGGAGPGADRRPPSP